MVKELIKCPECGAEFELSQAISHDIEISVAKKYEKQIKDLKSQSQRDLELREKELTDRFKQEQKRLEEKSKKETEEAIKQLDAERKRIEEQAKKRAQDAVGVELADLKEELAGKEKKLAESQKIELELRKRQRELKERERSLELEAARQVDAERQKIIENTQKEFDEAHRLKDAEKDKQLEGMKKQIDDLKKKAEQASQKMQGEVLEVELEQLLKEEFQFDDIVPVSSGVRGADVVQIVKTQHGRICGKILWETKRTKMWSDGWIQKLKEDQRKERADLSVIVSEVLPKGFHHFRQVHDVWVADIPSALSLAIALRMMMIQVARTKEIQTGKEEKMEIVYNYLTGTEFRNRIQAIMEAFISMKQGLDAEKRAV